ncbi:MAG: hypothetical protein OEZ12_06690 [Candidatus Bathyarchaeota archaeon]|nr:hypothetical protein [Candidatus Bathyarchaeota archaeon]
MKPNKTLLLLVIPIAFFAVGGFTAWRATLRGVEVYPLMTGFILIFIGLFAFVLILGQALLQRAKRN